MHCLPQCQSQYKIASYGPAQYQHPPFNIPRSAPAACRPRLPLTQQSRRMLDKFPPGCPPLQKKWGESLYRYTCRETHLTLCKVPSLMDSTTIHWFFTWHTVCTSNSVVKYWWGRALLSIVCWCFVWKPLWGIHTLLSVTGSLSQETRKTFCLFCCFLVWYFHDHFHATRGLFGHKNTRRWMVHGYKSS